MNEPGTVVRSTGGTANRGRRADREEALAEARAKLGEQAFARAWSYGQSLSPEAAIAYGLSTTDPEGGL